MHARACVGVRVRAHVHTGPLELFVALWALAVVGPRVEAAVGSPTFLAVYLLSGYSAALTTLALQQAALLTGAPFVSPADASVRAGQPSRLHVFVFPRGSVFVSP